MRNGWRKGEWLIIDAESGMTRYSSEVKRDYTGVYVTKTYADSEQPQDFIRPGSDPMPLPYSNPGTTNFTVSVSAPTYVGNTNVLTKPGPASHLF